MVRRWASSGRIGVVCAPGYHRGTGYKDRCDRDVERLRACGFVSELVTLDLRSGIIVGCWKFLRKMVGGRFDALIVEHYILFPVVLLFFGRKVIRGQVATVFHGVWQEARMLGHGPFRSAFTRCCELLAVKLSKRRLFVSEGARRIIEGKIMKGGSHISPNSPSSFSFDRPAFPEPEFLLGFSGGVQPWQDLDLLFSTVREIRKKRSVRVLILSRDPGVVQSLSEQYGVSDCVNVQSVAKDQVASLLSRCKFLWMVRRPNVVNAAACPTKALEYLLTGRPVVAHPSLGDVKEWATEFGGILLSESVDPAELAEIIASSSSSPVHYDLLQRFVSKSEQEFCRVAEELFNAQATVGGPRSYRP